MRLNARWAWFAAFTAVFAVLAAFVFWGTWSPDVAPVMPDNPVWHPVTWCSDWFRGWLGSGRFVPGDLCEFLGGPYLWQELKYVVALYCSGLALAWFLRGKELSYPAAYGAGLLLAFCGYWTTLFSAGHFGWFQWMTYGVFAFGLVDRALPLDGSPLRLRPWTLLGACVAWGSFYQPDLWLLFTVFTGVYFLYRTFRASRRVPGFWPGWTKGAAIAAVVFVAIGLPSFRKAFTQDLAGRDQQIAEGQTVGGEAKDDGEKRWIFATNWSMPPEDTLEFFVPRVHGDTSCPMTLQLGRAAGKDVKPYTGRLGRPLNAPKGNYRQHALYVGFLTCLLALLGVMWGVKGRKGDVVFFAVAALVFWVFSMGRFCEPVYRLVYALPFGDYLRAPVKWHHLTEFCLCALAGFGLEALHVGLKSRGLSAKLSLAIVSLVAVVGAADLARIDRLFCAPLDLRMVRGRNAAAEEAVRRGKGTVCDLVEGGRGLLAWSFMANGVGVSADPSAKDTRFVFAPNSLVQQNAQFAQWLKAAATPAGTYAFLRDGIRSAAPQASNVSLYQVNGVPPPAEPPAPRTDPVTLALGLLSLAGTLAAGACLVRRS